MISRVAPTAATPAPPPATTVAITAQEVALARVQGAAGAQAVVAAQVTATAVRVACGAYHVTGAAAVEAVGDVEDAAETVRVPAQAVHRAAPTATLAATSTAQGGARTPARADAQTHQG